VGAWDSWVAADETRKRFIRRTKPVTLFPAGDRFGLGCIAAKRSLKAQGFTVPKMDTEKPCFGLQAEEATILFQRAKGLTPDGIIGPFTAKVLFRPIARAAQDAYKIPNDLTCRKIGLESNWDPSCLGADGSDKGIAQINDVHRLPIGTLYNPAEAIPWAAAYLRNHFNNLGDWHAAVVAYNMGSGAAKEWLKAGKPATGGRTIKVNNQYYGLYEWATLYLSVVLRQSC
jgi:hypothetical protein